MIRIRRFKLKHRVTTLFRFILRRKNRSCSGYRRLDPISRNPKSLCKFFSCLKSKAKSLCLAKPSRISGHGYDLLEKNRRVPVPKGQMAVYVGSKDGGDSHRFLVPVIYFNHPLFGELLREAEEEFGFDHQGGITIPCRISEFESVQTKIAAGCGGWKMMTWKRRA